MTNITNPALSPLGLGVEPKRIQVQGLSFEDGSWSDAMRKHGRNGMLYDAGISQDGLYRYWLKREWVAPTVSPRLPFIMLNPSTADATEDDPTIRRCISFARREGYGGIDVLNLYAYRTKSPRVMLDAFDQGVDIVGPANDKFLANLAQFGARLRFPDVVCAWGAHPSAASRAQHVVELLRSRGARPMCLGLTSQGNPRHPLYVRGDQPLIEL